MTLDELKSLRPGEVVIFTKRYGTIQFQDAVSCSSVGDEMTFLEIEDADKIGASGDVVNFLRNSSPDPSLKTRDRALRHRGTILHFSYEICNYIERKTQLERDNKLEELGI